MRVSKEMKDKVLKTGTSGLDEIFTEEMDLRVESLKKATDMNTVSRHQGAIEVLDALLKLVKRS